MRDQTLVGGPTDGGSPILMSVQVVCDDYTWAVDRIQCSYFNGKFIPSRIPPTALEGKHNPRGKRPTYYLW